MIRPYSRLTRIQERKNVRSAIVFGILTIAFAAFLFIYGIPLMARFAGFILNIKGSTKIVESTDTIPPGPPFINTLPENTNKAELEIGGFSERGATVTIYINNNKKEIVTDASGQFNLKTTLQKGVNIIYASAADSAGNKSVSTKQYTVTFDDEKPILDITKPKDGDSFSGKNSQKITIEGKTKSGSTVTINDRFVNVNDDGTFSYIYPLGDGDNNLNIKSTDAAGNQTEKNIKVTYSS